MHRLFLPVIVIFIAMATASAQSGSRLITGLVTCADDGSRLEGAAVWVKGTKNYSGSQQDGIYYIPVSAGDSVLVFFRDGFDQQELRLSHETEYNIQLRRSPANRQKKSRKRADDVFSEKKKNRLCLKKSTWATRE